MRIHNGFVAKIADGAYLYIKDHQGQILEVNTVIDIDNATVRTQPGARDRREAQKLAEYTIQWLPVQVRRETVITQGE